MVCEEDEEIRDRLLLQRLARVAVAAAPRSDPRMALEGQRAESAPTFLTRNGPFLSRIPAAKNVPRKPLIRAASHAILRARSLNGVGGPLGIETNPFGYRGFW